jgi:hypothetical protein
VQGVSPQLHHGAGHAGSVDPAPRALKQQIA